MSTSSIYHPLESPSSHVRLLQICPTSSPIIECNLEIADLEASRDRFVALSYEWGTLDNSQSIVVNGQELHISFNLFDFLRNFRDRSKQRTMLWIDQICINQDDLQEKSSQIQLMQEIYTHAQQTVLWLGSDLAHGMAFACLRRVNAVSGTPRHQVWASHISEQDKQAVVALLCLSYWRRHWIVQEVCLSRRPVLMYGPALLSWQDFQRAVLVNGTMFSMSLTSAERETTWCCRQLLVLRADLPLFFGQNHETIWDKASQIAYGSLCKDLRDKVYGIQSMFPLERRISVDYTKSIRAVYFAAVEQNFDTTIREFKYYVEGCLELATGMNLLSIDPTIDSAAWHKLKEELSHVCQGPAEATTEVSQEKWYKFQGILNPHILRDELSSQS